MAPAVAVVIWQAARRAPPWAGGPERGL